MPEVYSQNGKCLNTGTFIDVKCDAKKYKKEIKALKKIYIYIFFRAVQQQRN